MSNCPFKRVSDLIPQLQTRRLSKIGKSKGVGNFGLIGLTPEGVSDIFDKLDPGNIDRNVMSGNTLRYFSNFQEFRDISFVGIEIFLSILFHAGIIPEIHMRHIESNKDEYKNRLFTYWISAIYGPDRFLSELIERSSTLEEFDAGLVYVRSILYKLAREPQGLEQLIEQKIASLLSHGITYEFSQTFEGVLQQLEEIGTGFHECPALKNGIIKRYLNAVIPMYRQCMTSKIQYNNTTPIGFLKRKLYKLLHWQ